MTMTVQDMIDKLSKVEDKSKLMFIAYASEEFDFMGFEIPQDSIEDNVNVYININDTDICSC